MKKILVSLAFFTTTLLLAEGFDHNTQIKTPNGYIRLEEVKPGLIIESFDTASHTISSHPVLSTYRESAESYIVIMLENEEITCSPNQKFYIDSLNTWVKAKELLIDEKIRSHFCKNLPIIDILKINEPKELYTLTINPHHNFIITQKNIIVHNFAAAVAVPLITYSAGEGFILFGGLGVAGVTGVVYRETITSVMQSVVDSVNGKGNGKRNSNNQTPRPPDQNPPSNPPGNDNKPQKANNFEDVLKKTAFGASIVNKVKKTKKIVQGQRVYSFIEKAKEFGLKKGDQIYLDAQHLDHLEVFDKYNSFKKVIDLAGNFIEDKTIRGYGRIIK